MSIVVQKYGGTSVADAARIMNVARRIVETYDRGHSVCAVVSARGDTTDELLQLAYEITPHPPEREMDMLLSTGERISCALLAMAIDRMGKQAVSFTGSQAGIVTDTVHTKARILDVRASRLEEAMAEGKIVLVAGFQGVSTEKDVTTLGRGGSDTTAVALAHALNADVCEIYTDVEGVYTANPSLVSRARKIPAISYDEMLELAASGAQVLAMRSVEYARKYNIPIHVRSSFSDAEGTWVREEDETMESAIIRGVTYTHRRGQGDRARRARPPGRGRPRVRRPRRRPRQRGHDHPERRRPGPQRHLLHHPRRRPGGGQRRAAGSIVAELGAKGYSADDNIAKVSLVGAGMRTNPGVAAKMFKTLADHGINLEMISTSPIKVACVIAKDRVEEAVRALHEAFELDKELITKEHADRGAPSQ